MDMIAIATFIVAFLTLVSAWLGVWYAAKALNYAAKTLNDSIKVSRAQFFATVRGLLSKYDEVHTKLRPDGAWGSPHTTAGPQTAAEWASVELYMGLFEYCERLLDQGLLNQHDFDCNLRYRVCNIVANRVIRETKLCPPLVNEWRDFVALCKRCGIKISECPSDAKPGEASPS
jgi:hypothetical protein